MYQTKEKSSVVLAHSVASSACDAVVSCKDNGITDRTQNQVACASEMYFDTSELLKKFTPKRSSSIKLSESYARIGFESKAHRVSDCGTFLEFAHEISEYGEIALKGKLHYANFCRDRLCPMCAWRRSYKIYAQVSQIMELIGSKYKYLFLTLTVPNVPAETLSNAVDELLKSWNRYMGYKQIKSVVKGYFRALEITRNKQNGTYHPHFHVVLAVPLSYGKHFYVSRDEWLHLWQRACRDESITQVDIRVAKDKHSSSELEAQQNLASAVAEVAKYAVKDSDYILTDNESLTDSIVKLFSDVLYHRRLASFGGCFKDAFAELQLEDAESEDADLTHINEKLNPALAWLICRYGWSVGAYQLIDERIETAEEHNAKH